MVTEEILSPKTFFTEWTSRGYCKTYDFFFWLIFLVSFFGTYSFFPDWMAANQSSISNSINHFYKQ